MDDDGRPRERLFETRPAPARAWLIALRQELGRWTPELLDRPVQVQRPGGIEGGLGFDVRSGVGRGLSFLASHAVHRFALLTEHLHRHGVPMPLHVGKAPGTVANEIATHRADALTEPQENSCRSPSALA